MDWFTCFIVATIGLTVGFWLVVAYVGFGLPRWCLIVSAVALLIGSVSLGRCLQLVDQDKE